MKNRLAATKKVGLLKPEKTMFEKGEMGVVLEFMVTDKDGRVRRHEVMKSRSYLRQFLDLLLIQMQLVPEFYPAQIRDVGNVIRDIALSKLTFAADAPVNNDTYGIIAGTGVTAPTVSDYKIETKIAHGSGVGQLQYGAITFGLPTAGPVSSHFTITRNFSNGSGGLIVVNELALYVKGEPPLLAQRPFTGTPLYFCTIRDVIAGGINVLNGETLTVNYRQQVTA